jgi:hypothetical protein
MGAHPSVIKRKTDKSSPTSPHLTAITAAIFRLHASIVEQQIKTVFSSLARQPPHRKDDFLAVSLPHFPDKPLYMALHR